MMDLSRQDGNLVKEKTDRYPYQNRHKTPDKTNNNNTETQRRLRLVMTGKLSI
jgi:hypothetical protein